MIEKIKNFLTVHKTTVILIGILGLLGFLGWLVVQKFTSTPLSVEEIDLVFDPEGPYALAYPRRDGNALILNLKRTSSYDAISYELAYTSKVDEIAVEGTKIREEERISSGGVIDRGVVGTIDTKERKGEYEQEILFGTCSKNVCKYDQGVENGTLALHIKKGRQAFRMITQWHLQKPDIALGNLTSGDGHFVYRLNADRQALANISFSIVNDLTGVPKLPSGKDVLGKVYSINVPIAKQLPAGDITLELAQSPPADSKLYRYDDSKSKWEELETLRPFGLAQGGQAQGKLSAKANGAGIFAVLIPKE